MGYVALTCGYSIEFGGPDAFVDELFITPPARERGFAEREGFELLPRTL